MSLSGVCVGSLRKLGHEREIVNLLPPPLGLSMDRIDPLPASVKDTVDGLVAS